eukprot:TRINITY_DN5020_c2_g1_i1.p1 TRINITY_DN5020_c2_g1~~TRINITY_DN5020_c2_g1_i1.p1  ORF type:complete len:186 (+),score=28.43 TRINITY_DN5020_c2_g1_i1:65-559(+)
MAEDKPSSGQRGALPGIPHYVDRVSAECIWKTFCGAENDYVRERTKNPPVAETPQLSNLHGFEVVKKASYMCVRRAKPQSKPTSELTEIKPAGPMSRYLDENPVATGPPPFIMPEVKVTEDKPPVVLAKYRRFSEDHMYPLEAAPDRNPTSRNLRRSLSAASMR